MNVWQSYIKSLNYSHCSVRKNACRNWKWRLWNTKSFRDNFGGLLFHDTEDLFLPFHVQCNKGLINFMPQSHWSPKWTACNRQRKFLALHANSIQVLENGSCCKSLNKTQRPAACVIKSHERHITLHLYLDVNELCRTGVVTTSKWKINWR